MATSNRGRKSVETLTNRQRELLTLIEDSLTHEQRVPSYREMAKALKVSAVGTIQDLVKALLDKGYLEKTDKGLRLAGARQSPSLTVPIIGEVAAGSLQDAFEVALGSMPISPELLKHSGRADDFFALRVSGESMIEAGILPKDYLIVHRGARVRTGDIVVASHRGEATVKELKLPKGGTMASASSTSTADVGSKKGSGNEAVVELIPKNRSLKPIIVRADEDFKILGKVVAVQRYLN